MFFQAFPDSNSGVMGDSQFHFRVRLSPQQCASSRLLKSNKVHMEYNRKCPSSIAIDPNYLFGFAYFRQVSFKAALQSFKGKL